LNDGVFAEIRLNMGEKIVKVLNILYNRLDLNMARILYLVPLTSHTHIHTHTHTRVCQDTCDLRRALGSGVLFSRQKFYCIPYEALKEGTRVSKRASIHT